jgi:sulfonate transport system permease protein
MPKPVQAPSLGRQIRTVTTSFALIVVRSLILPAAIVLLWHVASTRGWVSSIILPPPSVVWQTLKDEYANGDIALHTKASLVRLSLGFFVGAGSGLLVGFAIGLSRKLEDILAVPFQVVNLVPTLGWLPVLILILGLNEKLAAALIGQSIFIAVAINTYRGLRQIPLSQIEITRVYKLSFFQTLRKVILPAALPQIFTGLRAGLANGWIALVVVELLVCSEGLGYLMSQGRSLFQLDLVLVGILLVGTIGWILDAILVRLEAHLRRWQPKDARLA